MGLVEVENLTYSYPGREAHALSGINLEVLPGEFLLMLGESGSGKSTLCRALNGLVPHFYGGRLSGSVRIKGIKTTDSTVSELSKHAGMVFQDPENQIVTELIESEVAFGLENTGVPQLQMKKRVQEVLATLRLSPLKERRTDELSGGQKQKVALASILVMHPDLIVLDEPTSQLDPISAEDFLATLKSLNDELGLAVVLTEHRIEKCLHFADRAVVLEQGRIAFNGTPGDLLKWAGGNGRVPLPPISELFIKNGTEEVPLTVKEGREKIQGMLNINSKTVLDNVKKPSRNKAHSRGSISTSDSVDTDKTPFLEVKDLYYVYGNGTEALKGVNLGLFPGEAVAVIGENGSGKSTLIRHFNGLLKPSRGKVLLKGGDISNEEVSELAKTCGILGQNPNLQLIAKTVSDEIRLTLAGVGIDDELHDHMLDGALKDFDLLALKDENPQDLSCGQRERLALASIAVYRPELLVLDEPTRGIDKSAKAFLGDYLDEYRGKGNTVIVVTHDLEFAASFCDRFVFMSDGTVLVDGERSDVLSDSLFFTTQFNKSFRGMIDGIITFDEAARALEALR